MFLLGTLRALPPVVNPNLIVIKIFKASVATLFQKLIVRPKIDKKSREKNQEKNQEKIGLKLREKIRGKIRKILRKKPGKKRSKTV